MASYTVKSGDTLWGIAQSQLGSGARWKELGYTGDPTKLQVGTVLNWGAPAPAPAPAPAAPAVNVSQPLADYASTVQKDMQALLDRQKAEQQGLFNQYTTKIGSQEALPTLYKRLTTEMGIPELSQQAQAFKDEIFKTKQMLDRLDEDVTSRTTGTMTSEAQRRRMVEAEGGDLRNQLGRLGTGLEPVAEMLRGAQGEVGTLLNLQAAQNDRELKPLEMQIAAISDRFAREMTGFTTTKEAQLTYLMDKLERDRFLADRDWELAQQLAKEERDFAKSKSLAQMQITANSALNRASTGSTNFSSSTPSWNSWASGGSQSGTLRVTSGGSGQVLQPAASGSVLQPSGGANLQGSGGVNLQGGGALNFSGGLKVR